MKKSLLVAMIAGAAAQCAWAQSEDMTGIPVQAWGPEHVLNHPQGGYGARTPVAMWDSGLPAETGGGFAGPGADPTGVIRVIGDDIIPSAAAGVAGGYSIIGVRFGAWVAANNTVDTADHRMTVYPTFNAAANPVYSGTPIEEIAVRVGGHIGANGQGFFFPADIAIAGGVTFPAFAGGFLYMDVVDDVTLPTPTVVTGINNIRRANGTMPAGGGNLLGYFSANGSTVMNSTNYTPAAGAAYPTNWRAAFATLRVDAVVVEPPADFDMGCVSDGTTSHSFTLADNDVYWINMCLNGDATDEAGLDGQFCDVDTEGSAGAQAAIAIYDATGALVGSDIESAGSGSNAQMSYGVGRRASVGDGVQYDGRSSRANAVHGLAAGNYKIAVAPLGSSFSSGWAVTATGTGGGATLNVRTNANGTALAPSVAPNPELDMGQLVAPGGQIPAGAVGSYQVRWFKFNTCRTTDASNTVQVNMNGSATTASTAMYLFNGSGGLVSFSTFGAGGIAPPMDFNDTNVLPAGDYYLAITYQGVNLSQMSDRWHLRSTNGSNGFNMQGEVLVSWPDCPSLVPCELADTNCDGSLNGFDVEATEQAVNGDFSNFCLQSADLNNDGAENGFDVEFSEFLTLNC